MPLDVLSDGFVNLCFDTSLNFFDGKCRLLVEGQYVENEELATPVIPDKPMRITSKRYIDDMFTAGSILAESLKTVFDVCGDSVDVYALPREDAGDGVAAVYEIAFTGPATTDGSIDIFLGNEQYSITGLAVVAGDTAEDVAAAVVAAIPAAFPYTATQGTDANDHKVILTAKNKGTVGNYLNPIFNWRGFQNYYPGGIGYTVTRTTAGSNDPDPVTYATALGDCCYGYYALLSGDRTWQQALITWIRSAWSCDKPQCFGHGYTYSAGSLGTVLATFENAAEISKLAIPTDVVNFPWQMVADYAARSACTTCNNPELSVQGRTYGLMTTIKRPMTCDLPWSADEMDQLKEAGFVAYAPLGQGQGQLTSPFIVNDVTNWLYDAYNRPNATFRDTNSRRLATATAIAVATQLNELSGLALYTRNTRVPQGIKGTNLRLITAAMHDFATRNVGILWSDFDNLEKDLVIKEDFEVAAPCQGVPCKLHMFMRYRPPCRISEVVTKLMPKLLDNCVR